MRIDFFLVDWGIIEQTSHFCLFCCWVILFIQNLNSFIDFSIHIQFFLRKNTSLSKTSLGVLATFVFVLSIEIESTRVLDASPTKFVPIMTLLYVIKTRIHCCEKQLFLWISETKAFVFSCSPVSLPVRIHPNNWLCCGYAVLMRVCNECSKRCNPNCLQTAWFT